MYQSVNKTSDRFSWDASTEAAYWLLRSETAITPPIEITLSAFMDAISKMRPLDWQGDAHSESFKLSEMYCGNVTDIYAKIGIRYFEFRDVVTLSHEEIIERVEKEVLSQNQK
ncbi:hypothetical protein HRD68_00735 (plasmid) [Yersinia massiliensis]|uniref:hypothetical protein n=1 Tax=Yersinia massiliensis TaxID=419257 RepID=UPI001561D0CB|nr:hypothetical protein [Yersinia massiliensis]QKJ09385.1 hypothetical protein HRD68_00735 [Yersinia massiliensis]